MSSQIRAHPRPPRERGVFCNRTLNLRAIRAVGYDMDYTLIHYRIEEWERRAYEHLRHKLLALGWPLAHLEFDPQLVIRGLILDLERGNILKANRFGYVKRAYHGTRPLPFEKFRQIYSREMVSLGDERYVFLNTLFSLSEACMYAQLVELLDAGELQGALGYGDLYRLVRTSIDEAHMEGELKAEITADPDRFVERDPELPLALLDQRHAGKKLLLITNSEWDYTRAMMSYAFDQFLPADTQWRDLFDLVLVSARKPSFFWERGPVFDVANETGLLTPSPKGILHSGIYWGGHAGMVEEYLGLSGDEILYVGDHIYTDVHVSKNVFRWRTALVLRELESDLGAAEVFEEHYDRLAELMQQKEELEFQHSQVRVELQRRRGKYGPAPQASGRSLDKRLTALRDDLQALDEEIAPLAVAAGKLSNSRWGLLMRAGNDKSLLARQVERYADIYTSRVSNFLYETPFAYFRSPRGPLPHDPELAAGAAEEEQS
ncbi:MAG: HAD-IG family 5'-nucleotidase [Gemmatimonadales bacterium]|nr:HAD-IG family 5'-nucleotidase [Gemmatimonadales bacterium]NIN50100.1 HAD-IG family 5'-nucleotidase [Gemmatimonadales bacterium]NIP07564.1 HAD-IG family 5'-nucleotidase [Gemmatimonadales bacterium]NIR01720.1 HAD-IG family 5'-nucleotidase [Gemmatimonadales bacterium]NIS65623.1 HAD-IG family 5'-nucleotidase [Gemmatimonadales bacterium]